MISIIHFKKDEWTRFAEDAHKACFDKIFPAKSMRFDFALLVAKGDLAMGYVTCREIAEDTVYIQWGGAFPGTRHSVNTWPGYLAIHAWLGQKYKKCVTHIENDNCVMLKMAMKRGYRICGLRHFENQILLEHLLEL